MVVIDEYQTSSQPVGKEKRLTKNEVTYSGMKKVLAPVSRRNTAGITAT
jgi:hypothetical protein